MLCVWHIHQGEVLLWESAAIQDPSQNKPVMKNIVCSLNGSPFRLPWEFSFQISICVMDQDSDHHLNTGLLFTGTMVPGIWIVDHLNNEPVKVCYSDVSAIQKFAIQIHTVYLLVVLWLSQWFDILHKTSPFSPLLHER